MADARSDKEFLQWESDTSIDLHATLEVMRTEEPPQDSLNRATDWANALSCEQTDASDRFVTTSVQLGSVASWYVTSRRYAVLAAGLAAVLLPFIWFFPSSAWAQVVEAVAAKPWIRLSLVQPRTELPDEEVFQEVVMWFRGDSSIAAVQSAQQSAWVDLRERTKSEFRPLESHVTLTKLGSVESSQIQTLLSALSPFQSETVQSSGIELMNRSEVIVDDREYIDFSFISDAGGAPEVAFPLSVRVEKTTMLPTQLTIREASFAIDYPEAGPNDIYALNVPRSLEVKDLRSLEKFFIQREPLSPVDYEAVELTFFPWLEGQWLTEAARYRFIDGDTVCDRADLEQILKLSQEKRETKEAASSEWWIEQVAGLDHQRVELGGYNFPHNRCYMPFGGIESYDSAGVSSLQGLEGTIEIRGTKKSVWLDQNRDLIVRRYEYIDDSGKIRVFQIDEVLQDTNGVWFATRWRQGEVSQRGELLSDSKRLGGQSGVATTVHIAAISFQ